MNSSCSSCSVISDAQLLTVLAPLLGTSDLEDLRAVLHRLVLKKVCRYYIDPKLDAVLLQLKLFGRDGILRKGVVILRTLLQDQIQHLGEL